MTHTRGGAANTANSMLYRHSPEAALATWITRNVPATARNAIDYQCGQAYAGMILAGIVGVIGGTGALIAIAVKTLHH